MVSRMKPLRPDRRQLLKYLLASPLIAGLQPFVRAEELLEAVISDPSQALNVFDFEVAARHALPPAHYGYIATGVIVRQWGRDRRDPWRMGIGLALVIQGLFLLVFDVSMTAWVQGQLPALWVGGRSNGS